MHGSIVIIKISFNVEENEAGFSVANDEIIGFIRRDFFDDELVRRRIQRFRKDHRISSYEAHRARFGTAQNIVKNKDRKKRIGTASKRTRSRFDSSV